MTTEHEQDITMQDRVKRLYQRAFGGGHMIGDPQAAMDALRDECAQLGPAAWEEPLFEPLGPRHCRMHLRPMLASGLSPQTASAMFVQSANTAEPDLALFEAHLDGLARTQADRDWLDAYRRQGCPMVRHSAAYRERFRPAYRIVHASYAAAFALILAIDRLPSGIIALDGPCASGKSTLAAQLGALFDMPVFHTDDFFLRPRQRTARRLAEPGGNFDRERFARQVVSPLLQGRPVFYSVYDCGEEAVREPIIVPPSGRALVEGAYSHHPALAEAYSLRAFLKVAPQEQLRRLRERSPSLYDRFVSEWIPMENQYFQAFDIEGGSDVVLLSGADA